jgi:hypothetical protein
MVEGLRHQFFHVGLRAAIEDGPQPGGNKSTGFTLDILQVFYFQWRANLLSHFRAKAPLSKQNLAEVCVSEFRAE